MNGKYRVNCLLITGKRNKTFKSGAEVTAEDFTTEQLGSHIGMGKLVLVDGEAEKVEETEQSGAEVTAEGTPLLEALKREQTMKVLFTFKRGEEEVNVFEEEDITKAELLVYMDEVLKIEFNSANKKGDLFRQALDHLAK